VLPEIQAHLQGITLAEYVFEAIPNLGVFAAICGSGAALGDVFAALDLAEAGHWS
jgi:hypothetical protein